MSRSRWRGLLSCTSQHFNSGTLNRVLSATYLRNTLLGHIQQGSVTSSREITPASAQLGSNPQDRTSNPQDRT